MDSFMAGDYISYDGKLYYGHPLGIFFESHQNSWWLNRKDSTQLRNHLIQNQMDILNAQLQSIGFKYIPQHGTQAWSKRYDGFVLFVAKSLAIGHLYGAIRVGKVEISIPFTIDLEWIKQFDEENGG